MRTVGSPITSPSLNCSRVRSTSRPEGSRFHMCDSTRTPSRNTPAASTSPPSKSWTTSVVMSHWPQLGLSGFQSLSWSAVSSLHAPRIASSSCASVNVTPLAATDQLDAIPVRVADEAEEAAALAHLVRRPLRLDALLAEPRERAVEVVDADRDVAVAGPELVRAAVVVERQLEHRLGVAER